MNSLKETNYTLPLQTAFYKGKVRDVYTIADRYLVMVVSDRISAFDVVLPRAIPYKGQVLNQIAARSLKATEDIVPNWLLDVPDPTVSVGRICVPFKVEMVIRAYLSGHAWREYQAGKRQICGESLPDGLNENDRLPKPIITPTTKAHVGHDEDTSAENIIDQGVIDRKDYEKIADYTRRLFARGTALAAKQNLILVDTKYEFGKIGDEIYLIDEIHTPDSSRYFYFDTYQDLQDRGEPQRQLSKEFVRKWLIENGFQGKEGQVIPPMSDKVVESISNRYIELYEQIIGEKFVRADQKDINNRVEKSILDSLKKIAKS